MRIIGFQFAILTRVTLVGGFFHFMAMARLAGLGLHVKKYSLELVNTPPHNHESCFSPSFPFKFLIYLFLVSYGCVPWIIYYNDEVSDALGITALHFCSIFQLRYFQIYYSQ